jgi:hypothetical protein
MRLDWYRLASLQQIGMDLLLTHSAEFMSIFNGLLHIQGRRGAVNESWIKNGQGR